LGGVQQIITETAAIRAVILTCKQMQWAAGMQWRVANGADVVGSIGQIGVSFEGGRQTQQAQKRDFDQLLVDLSLNVKF
jgi:hypothetical protein